MNTLVHPEHPSTWRKKNFVTIQIPSPYVFFSDEEIFKFIIDNFGLDQQKSNQISINDRKFTCKLVSNNILWIEFNDFFAEATGSKDYTYISNKFDWVFISNFKKDYLRHGEAVGIGIMCEIYYSHKGKSALLEETENILKIYNLPTKIFNTSKNIDFAKIQNNIYQGIFLDKKKINKHPRYISLKKKYKPQINEIENLDLLNHTIKFFLN